MNTLPVIACAESRLHADVMLIRLRRAGIPCHQISAFFPRRSVPNAVACWLSIGQNRGITVGDETIVPAGKMRTQFATSAQASSPGVVVEAFVAQGLDRVSAEAVEERLKESLIAICVHATDEIEASVAWHIFHHASAELVVMGHNRISTIAPDASDTSLDWAAAAA